MNKKKLFIIWLILIFISGQAYAMSYDDVEDIIFNILLHKFTEFGEEINIKWVNKFNNFSLSDVAKKQDIKNRVYYLGYFSKNRKTFKNNIFDVYEVDNYNWEKLWLDSYCIVWQESWFVNYLHQDDKTGFGWGALQWSTVEWLATIYEWDWEKDKNNLLSSSGYLITTKKSDKIQAKYIIGYLLYLYNHYEGERGKVITGYNKGFNVKNYHNDSYYRDIINKEKHIFSNILN